MRLALFHNLPPGGGKRALFGFAQHLRERGVHLDLFLYDAADSGALSIAPLAESVIRVETGIAPARGDGLPLGNLRWWVGAYRRLDWAAGIMAKRIDAGGYDIAFVQQCMLSGGAPYLLRHLRLPSVFYCAEPRAVMREVGGLAGSERQIRWRERLGIALQNRVLGYLEASSARAATTILTCSHYSAGRVVEAYGVTPEVVPSGVDGDLFRPLDGISKERLVLSAGELAPRKAHDFVIDAVGRIPNPRRPRVVIAAHRGLPSESTRLAEVAARRDVDLEFRHPSGDPELVELYNRASVLAYAPIREPLGLVPLEAMSCGTPVVAVGEAGVLETVTPASGGLLTERDPNLFAEALSSVLGDSKAQSRMSAEGREYVLHRWNWPSAADRLLSCLDQTVRDRST